MNPISAKATTQYGPDRYATLAYDSIAQHGDQTAQTVHLAGVRVVRWAALPYSIGDGDWSVPGRHRVRASGAVSMYGQSDAKIRDPRTGARLNRRFVPKDRSDWPQTPAWYAAALRGGDVSVRVRPTDAQLLDVTLVGSPAALTAIRQAWVTNRITCLHIGDLRAHLGAALTTSSASGAGKVIKSPVPAWYEAEAGDRSISETPNSPWMIGAVARVPDQPNLATLRVTARWFEAPRRTGAHLTRGAAWGSRVARDWFAVAVDEGVERFFNQHRADEDRLSREDVAAWLVLGMFDRLTHTPVPLDLQFGRRLLTWGFSDPGYLATALPGVSGGAGDEDGASSAQRRAPRDRFQVIRGMLQMLAERHDGVSLYGSIPWFTRAWTGGPSRGRGLSVYVYHPEMLHLHHASGALSVWRDYAARHAPTNASANA